MCQKNDRQGNADGFIYKIKQLVCFEVWIGGEFQNDRLFYAFMGLYSRQYFGKTFIIVRSELKIGDETIRWAVLHKKQEEICFYRIEPGGNDGVNADDQRRYQKWHI